MIEIGLSGRICALYKVYSFHYPVPFSRKFFLQHRQVVFLELRDLLHPVFDLFLSLDSRNLFRSQFVGFVITFFVRVIDFIRRPLS